MTSPVHGPTRTQNVAPSPICNRTEESNAATPFKLKPVTGSENSTGQSTKELHAELTTFVREELSRAFGQKNDLALTNAVIEQMMQDPNLRRLVEAALHSPEKNDDAD